MGETRFLTEVTFRQEMEDEEYEYEKNVISIL